MKAVEPPVTLDVLSTWRSARRLCWLRRPPVPGEGAGPMKRSPSYVFAVALGALGVSAWSSLAQASAQVPYAAATVDFQPLFPLAAGIPAPSGPSSGTGAVPGGSFEWGPGYLYGQA